MRRRSLLMAIPLSAASAALAACGVTSRAGKGATSSASANASSSPGAETAADGGGFTLVDVAGRSVTFSSQPQRIICSESRHVFSTLFLNKDNPVDKIVAWADDLQKAAPDIYDKLVELRPEAANIPIIGSVAKNEVSVETLSSYTPDVILLTLDAYDAAKENGFTDKLDSQGLTYVVTDFRRYPAQNTLPSVALIAALVDRRDEGTKFADFYRKQVDPVVEKAKSISSKPATFLWRGPGLNDPCSTYTSKANLGMLIPQTGGTNVADDLLSGEGKSGEEGVLTPEQIIKINPTNIIATGGEWGQQKIKDTAKTSYVHLGYKADADSARASLTQLQNEPGFEQLTAFGDKRVFGVYHQFYDAPFNFIAYLAFAKWQNPSEFSDIDPDSIWSSFHDDFMPWKSQGVFVVGL